MPNNKALLEDISEYVRDAYAGKMNNFESMRRGVALSARIQIAMGDLNRDDWPVLAEALKEYKERIFRILANRFVQPPEKPKWTFAGRDDLGRYRFTCSTGEERLIPADQYWGRK